MLSFHFYRDRDTWKKLKYVYNVGGWGLCWPVYDVDDNVGGGEDNPGDPVYLAHWVERLFRVADGSGYAPLTRAVLGALICHLKEMKLAQLFHQLKLTWDSRLSCLSRVNIPFGLWLASVLADWNVVLWNVYIIARETDLCLMVHARQTRKEGNITGAQTISIPKQTSSIMQSVISAASPPLPHTWTFCWAQRTSWPRGGGSGSCSPGCEGCGWSLSWCWCSGWRSSSWRSRSQAWLSYGTLPVIINNFG